MGTERRMPAGDHCSVYLELEADRARMALRGFLGFLARSYSDELLLLSVKEALELVAASTELK